jgi:hypothetical protein
MYCFTSAWGFPCLVPTFANYLIFSNYTSHQRIMFLFCLPQSDRFNLKTTICGSPIKSIFDELDLPKQEPLDEDVSLTTMFQNYNQKKKCCRS